jgi:NAD(P)-dependent dehydrogenase (short-subunit alcohol dehydrogenase family)
MNDPILIFGGVDGIGGALATRLTAAGYRVAITSRDLDRARGFAQTIGAAALEADVLQSDSIERAVAGAAPEGRLGGLVYAVGSIKLAPLSRISDVDLIEAYRLNVVGATLAARAAATALKAATGSIVLFSSVAAAQGFPNHGIIGPAKAAVEGLTLALAAEFAPDIRVNCIAPSLTRTPMAEPIVGVEKMAEALAQMHPMRRLGLPEDIAALAAFLVSMEASWITGQIFGVDGGRGTLRTGRS